MKTIFVTLILTTTAMSACNKVTAQEHRKACGQYADIHVEAELNQRVKDVADEMKDKVRAEAKAELESEGRHEAFVERCMGETKGAGRTFVSCMANASSLTDSNKCVKNQQQKSKKKPASKPKASSKPKKSKSKK